MWRVCATIWKNNKYYIFRVFVCSVRYPACNAHAPYCHLWPARIYYVFQHYLTEGTTFEKKIIEDKLCVSVFSTTFETFLIL
jgi:hypothetical protein